MSDKAVLQFIKYIIAHGQTVDTVERKWLGNWGVDFKYRTFSNPILKILLNMAGPFLSVSLQKEHTVQNVGVCAGAAVCAF